MENQEYDGPSYRLVNGCSICGLPEDECNKNAAKRFIQDGVSLNHLRYMFSYSEIERAIEELAFENGDYQI